MTLSQKLKAPFPYFGGKSRIAEKVWNAIGDVSHYIEPFFGSGAVLLSRDRSNNRLETVNDKDGYVCNAWRGLKYNPAEVAKWCDWQVNHADLAARRNKLISSGENLLQNLIKDDEYFDAKLAAYWIWGMAAWVGGGFTTKTKKETCRRPNIGTAGSSLHSQKSDLHIKSWFDDLSERLRYVRVVCGDWSQVCGGNWQDARGTCGMFFDPPYGVSDRSEVYAIDDLCDVSKEVNAWCLRRGESKNMRIVIAGYYEEHENLLDFGWTRERWSAAGGFANKSSTESQGKKNRHRESLFFSPHCLCKKSSQLDLF